MVNILVVEDDKNLNKSICLFLAQKGFEIDRKIIVIKESIKEVGTYSAIVKLHKEVSANITLEVISE